MSTTPPTRRSERDPTVVDYMNLPLNDAQRRVVELERLDQHVLVAAPPGSGKTLTITRRIAQLLSIGAAKPEEVLALTFTERAANELITRLAAMTIPGISAGTFHGRCSTILRENVGSTKSKAPFVLWTDQQQLDSMKEAARAAGLKQVRPPHIRKLLRAMSRWKCSRLNIEEVVSISDLNAGLTEQIFTGYQQELKVNDALDFDDLIIHAADLLWSDDDVARRIHSRYRFVFVDEFQDVSPEQYRLLLALAPPRVAGRQVMVVADDNQAIFAFRGANPKEMLARYRRDYRPLIVPLRENHRSVAAIVGAAQQLMQAAGEREESESIRVAGFPIDCFEAETDRDEARLVTSLIERAKSKGYRAGQMAVLYRSHKRADLIEAALLDRGFGVRRIRQGRFYDQPDVQETIRYFELVASTQERSFVNAVNWPRFLVDELTMLGLRRIASDAGIGLGELAEQPVLLRAYATPLTATLVERFMADVVAPLRSAHDQPAAAMVEQMLDLLACRRDPVPRAGRADMRAVLDELGKGMEGIATTLDEALLENRKVVAAHDGHPDCVHAAGLLTRVLWQYFGVQVEESGVGNGECCLISLGARNDRAAISLTADPSGVSEFTVTARVYRLCQMVLMRREHLGRGRFVIFDLETTSDRPASAEILDAGAVAVANGMIQGEPFESKMRPSSAEAITLDSINIHGLTWELVAGAPQPSEILPQLLDLIGDATLVGHNIQRFDLPVLCRACEAAGLPAPANPVLDTLLLARRLRPGMPNALDDLLTPDEKLLRQRHGALIDAQLTARVFVRLVDMLSRDREIDVLSEELPVVAASIHSRNAARTADNQILVHAGARAYQFGRGQQPSTGAVNWLAQPGHESAATWIEQMEPEEGPDDQAWKRLREGWMNVVNTFRITSRDPSLAGLIDFVALATPSDLDTVETDRVSMMTVYSAKGHEWPVVFLIGLEDDQFPYSSRTQENEVEEGRRALYVGMTRAEERLILTHARVVEGKPRQPSRFLEDIRKHLVMHGDSGRNSA